MYTHEFSVLPSDSSCRGKIKLRSLLDYFQDTAGLAVEDIEGTTTELIARGYAWVLTRYEIDITGELPSLDEKFFVTTFHDPLHGYNTLRAFRVHSHDGREIVRAKTAWLLLDVHTGRPVKPIAHLPEITSRDTENIPPDFRDIPDFDDENILLSVNFPVRFHDLDYNAHVNNAAYFEWVFDACPVDTMTHELISICASFRSGAKLGENVTLNFAGDGEKSFRVKIMRPGVQKPSAMFACSWRSV